ncbi:uncharacterized protein LOC110033891 [Phalaenopsis equestris]|uniref:uncharacterized protein LOC110033891 n=1 Tax=Phalaenopsis equestris TaxID=78828 RepID=UPI0009E474CD|nr:uncharacterized protein LOC110033891 [Phalaenopsis equestris]
MAKRFLFRINSFIRYDDKSDTYQHLLKGLLCRRLSQRHQGEYKKKVGVSDLHEDPTLQHPGLPKPGFDPEVVRESCDDDDSSWRKWKVEFAWLSKALEPALQLYKWASTAGIGEKPVIPPSTRTLFEILTDLQASKAGIQEWSLSDLTVGLYLIHLSQASATKVEDFKGVQIQSESAVQELIYHLELAKGCYRDSTSSIARQCMLRERNILKFVKDSSLLRPGYYIGVDTRNKLVILAIRGTHTVYDLITNLVASSDQNVSFDGFSTHFGTAEAARWYLHHEMGAIRKLLVKHRDFRLRLVGHSLGGAAAALLAIMLRRKPAKELGFSPDIISAVGFGTPPCVSKELAESCASYVSTVVLQDDIIPRLSVASLARLRNEILETDWMTILEKEDWKVIAELVTNAKHVVSSVQDVARKLAAYATKFRKVSNSSEISQIKESIHQETKAVDSAIDKQNDRILEELYLPGTQYFLRREMDKGSSDDIVNERSKEFYTLWRRNSGEHFRRILLSGNLISDHKCENHYYALRDVLKGLPVSDRRTVF